MDDIMPTEILEDDEGSITHEDQEEFVYETHADVYSSPSKLLVPPDRDDSYESQESQEEDDNKHMGEQFGMYDDLSGSDLSEGSLNVDHVIIDTEKVESIERLSETDKNEYEKMILDIQLSIYQEESKNHYLHKRIIDYVRKRKMDTCLREADNDDSRVYVKRYKAQLLNYGTLIEDIEKNREAFTTDIEKIKMERDNQIQASEVLFQKLQAKEREVGIGLIHAKTGLPLQDKKVDMLLNQQKEYYNQVRDRRLKHIKLKMRVTDLEKRMNQLLYIGEGLNLLDYETLQFKNRSYQDKLDDREDELNKLRMTCRNGIQVLAHFREISTSTEEEIYKEIEELKKINESVDKTREKLNKLKTKRNMIRNQAYNLKESLGLLTNPDLLKDMEKSIDDLANLTDLVKEAETDNKLNKIKIRNIRKNMEKIPQSKKELDKLPAIRKSPRKVHRNRIILPVDAFKGTRGLPLPKYCLGKTRI